MNGSERTVEDLNREAEEAERRADALEARLLSERRLTTAVTQLHDSSPDDATDSIARSAFHAVGKGRAVLYREIDGESPPLSVASFPAADQSPANPAGAKARRHSIRELAPVVMTSNRPLIIRDTTRLRPTQESVSREAGSLIAVVVRTPSGARGILSVESDTSDAFDVEDLKVLEHVSVSSSMALAHADTFREMQQRAVHDALTGILRRDAFEKRFDVDIRRAIRYGHCVSVLVMDLDHFKSVNDTFGHQAGDDALRQVAVILQQNAPSGSHIGRLGGDEYALAFIGDDPSEAGATADRIRSAVERGLTRADGTGASISIGVAICPLHAHTTDSLLRAADAALYKAKRSGRNRVEIASKERHER